MLSTLYDLSEAIGSLTSTFNFNQQIQGFYVKFSSRQSKLDCFADKQKPSELNHHSVIQEDSLSNVQKKLQLK
jgi:hypothetical protein